MKFHRAPVLVAICAISLGVAGLGCWAADDLPPLPPVEEDPSAEAVTDERPDFAPQDPEREPAPAPAMGPLEGSLSEESAADAPPVPVRAAAPPAAVAKSAKKPAKRIFPGPKTLPPTGPYKILYFQNDFSYKADPEHDYVFGEELKDMLFALATRSSRFQLVESFATGS